MCVCGLVCVCVCISIIGGGNTSTLNVSWGVGKDRDLNAQIINMRYVRRARELCRFNRFWLCCCGFERAFHRRARKISCVSHTYCFNIYVYIYIN